MSKSAVRAAGLLASAVVLLVGVVVAGILSGVVGHAPGAAGATASPATGASVVRTVGPFGLVRDLVYDSSRNAIWFVGEGVDPGDTLYEVSVSDLAVRDWRMPAGAGQAGYLARVKLDQRGNLWANFDYALVRFEPSTSTFSLLQFTLDTPGVLPGAANPVDVSSGTWISAFGFQGGDILVARNLVPYLTLADQSMTLQAPIPVPTGYAGAWDIAPMSGGDFALLAGHGAGRADSTVVLDASGNLVSQLALRGTRLATANGSIVVTAGPGVGAVQSPGARLSSLVTTPGMFGSQLSFDPRGGVTLYDRGTGRIDRVVNGLLVSSIRVPTVQAVIHLPPVPGVTSAPNDLPPTSIAASVTAMVDVASGQTWYFDSGSGQLFVTTLP